VYEAPSHHPIHYYEKEEALGNAPSVADIAMKRRIPRDVVVVVVHVLKIFLMDSVVHNIPLCIWIMILSVGFFPISPRASSIHVLSRTALVVIIPCSVLITPVPVLRIP
jgi:hypothetical protein